MNSFKENLLQKSINRVPVVLVLKNGTPSVQKMDIDKWNGLSLDRQQKIRNYAKKRNEAILSTVDQTSYLESINSMLSNIDSTEVDDVPSDTPSKVQRDNYSPQALENDFTNFQEKETPFESPEILNDPHSDIDLTPNFVNTFFTYVNKLVKEFDPSKPEEKKQEDPNLNVPEKVVEKTIELPDYSDPAKCQSESESEKALPEGWTAHISATSKPGETYYFNQSTGETRWEKPVSPANATETPEGQGENKDSSPKEEKVNESTLPAGWKSHISQSSDPGKEYWYNEETGETKWDKPTVEIAPSSEWTSHTSESSDPGKVYYYNEKTGETKWEKPEGFVETKKEEEPVNKEELKCYHCDGEGGLNLFTYLIEENVAKRVRFCCFKCFEKKEF